MNVSEAPPTPYTRTQHVHSQRRLSGPIPMLGWLVFAAASANWLHLPVETWNLAWLPWNSTPRFPGAPSQLIPGRLLLRQLGVSQGQDWSPFSPLYLHMYFLADLSYSSGFQYHRHAVTPKVLFLVWVPFDLKFIVNYLSAIFHNSTA